LNGQVSIQHRREAALALVCRIPATFEDYGLIQGDSAIKLGIQRPDCKIRSKLDTDSDLNWTAIPEKIGQSFRF
jgi:hypothetical protein